MKKFEEYKKEIKKNVIDQWKKEGNKAFNNMEKDPVIDLLLSSLSYQAFLIQKDIEQFEEKTVRNFRDCVIPYQLIKPIPAFSIVETNTIDISEKTVDETCVFEFKKLKFVPLLKTKIINSNLKIVEQQDNVIIVELELVNPVESLSGLSFFIDTDENIKIESIKISNYELPLIMPSHFNELPFTKWFNNSHLFSEQNYFLYGSYDYWQEIFLTNSCKLYYISEYDAKEIHLNGNTNIELEITFNSILEASDKLKINCIPVVNVENKEITLDSRNPVCDLSSGVGEFLNLWYDKEEEKNIKEYADSFVIRQFGIERYNPKQLLEQMEEIISRYNSDYYAFQSIKGLKNSDITKKMQEIIDDTYEIVSKEFEDNKNKVSYYAVLKKSKLDNKSVTVNYLTTFGELGNGVKTEEKVTKTPIFIDRKKTSLLLETKGGKNGIIDESQKDDITKYYFQTKDRLITPADIKIFIRTFYYKNFILNDEVENIIIKPEDGYIAVSIKLHENSLLKETTGELLSLSEILQNKILLKSTGIMPYKVYII